MAGSKGGLSEFDATSLSLAARPAPASYQSGTPEGVEDSPPDEAESWGETTFGGIVGGDVEVG